MLFRTSATAASAGHRRLPVGAEAQRSPSDGTVDREQPDAVDAQQARRRQRLAVRDLLAQVPVLRARRVERGVDGEDQDVAAAQHQVLEEGAGALLGAVARDGDDLGAEALVELGLADREAGERALLE